MFIAAFCVMIMSGTAGNWRLIAVVSLRHQTVTSSSRILYRYDVAIIKCIFIQFPDISKLQLFAWTIGEVNE